MEMEIDRLAMPIDWREEIELLLLIIALRWNHHAVSSAIGADEDDVKLIFP